MSSLPCLSYEILAEYDDSSVSPWPEECANTKVKNIVDLSFAFLGTKRKENGRKNVVKCCLKGTKSGKDDTAVENKLGDFPRLSPVVKTLSCQCKGYRFNTSKIPHAVWCGQKKKKGKRSQGDEDGLKGTLKQCRVLSVPSFTTRRSCWTGAHWMSSL